MIKYKRPIDNLVVRPPYDYVDTYHDEFCQTDDPEKKSDALRLLKGYAAEYLNRVNHNTKFQVVSVERVLTQSIQNKIDFDPREASSAFEHLAIYGQNLRDQPWREEFKTLFLSSGYYVHNIQQYLHHPHEVLISMGYTNIDDSTLQLAVLLNPSELKRISRDCFLASQECLILGQIMDFVQTETKQGGITAAQVYFYRKEYLGDVTTIGRQICFDIRKHQHTESLKIQQQQVIKHPRQHPQEFENRMELDCPVGCLVDVEDAINGIKVGGEIPEREIVQKILRNTEREQEHIYDPVSIDDSIMSTGKFQQSSNMHNLSPSSPSINSSSSNFIYPSSEPSAFVRHHNNYAVPSYNHSSAAPADFGLPDPEQQHQRNLEHYYNSSTRSSTASPYIPQTVSSYFGNNAEQGMSNVDGDYSRKPSHYHNSSSSSSSGLPYQTKSKLPQQQQAFQKDKVSLDELRRISTNFDSNSNKYPNDALSKPDWQIQQFESSFSSSKSRSRLPLGRHSENTYTSQSRPKESTSPSLDDPSIMIQEALRYNNQVNSFAAKSRKSTSALESSQPYHLGKPSLHRESKEEREASYNSHHRKSSDSERESGNKSSASGSSEASSWGYSNFTDHNIQGTEKSTHFTDGVRKSLDCCDTSSIPVETEYHSYKNPDAISKSSIPPPKSPPTETNLDSLETVFYNKLISTDQNQESYHQQYPANNKVDDLNKTILSRNKKSLLHSSSSYGVKETSLDGPPNDDSKLSHKAYNSQSLPKKESSSNVQVKEKKIKDKRRQAQENEIPVNFKWTCPHCTYINHKDDENDKICDICAKSRDFVPEEPEIVQPTPTLKLYSTPNEDTTTMKKNKPNSSSYAVKDERQNQSMFKDETIVGDDQDKISCPHCTVLNLKTRLLCECCEQRIRIMKDED